MFGFHQTGSRTCYASCHSAMNNADLVDKQGIYFLYAAGQREREFAGLKSSDLVSWPPDRSCGENVSADLSVCLWF
ncbi:unnamed protein product [Protopolystoma xenopodis]|uniref:Uncharacterized protein n=1 Tax=Protopolystoma xenopodis TaxID=117903 RepID=A0A3S5B2D7_9PLAT|nr:unnamed protein product [Protopolystoma xenopodis]